ncbi:hypothetical protein KIN20_000815 [Parelaphostrongylus tenuis]|uniref:Uncharacterized protein n=1 Tax=Parelaphostrongylus tenuis TaxID=148309 RepID=A0AAD5LVA5_PARTN|nr:hypothetical protein KIN20_000815 [Parelaphostrongylus tenuis]
MRGNDDGDAAEICVCHNYQTSAALMVHDLREQVVQQKFEDLRQKMVQVARAAPSYHQPQQAVRSPEHHPNGRLTSPGPPHLSSLSTH